MMASLLRFVLAIVCLVALSGAAFAQGANPNWKAEWDKTLELAKKEGRVVVSANRSPQSNGI